MQTNLKDDWLVLWHRINAKGEAEPPCNDLVARYAESCRFYHTLEHIEFCLDLFKQIKHLLNNADAVELAIWFHDAIYDPKATDNEDQSAKYAIKVLYDASVSNEVIDLVFDLIIASKHVTIPNNFDAQNFVDIDLAILGQPNDKFNEYERQIRQEYEWVPRETFVNHRSKILTSFLDRDTIYLTKYFRDEYESQARNNIARSLAQLSNRS